MKTQIRVLRMARGLSPSEFAKMVNLATTNLCKIELAHDKAGPKLRSRLSSALSVCEAELFDQNGWPLIVDDEKANGKNGDAAFTAATKGGR